MTEKSIIEKNCDLLNDFMRYAFNKPEILDTIPRDAQLVLLPTNDPELYKENLKTVKRLKRTGKRHVVFKIESVMPKIEFVSAADVDEMVVIAGR
jgi:hypothetical protein